MCDNDFPKSRVWIRYRGEDLNFPALHYNQAEITALTASKEVEIHGEHYQVDKIVFSISADALIVYVTK